MVRVIFLFLILVHFSSSFQIPLMYFLNFRCILADNFLKDTFKHYDELIAPTIVSFYYHGKNKEPQKISSVNDTYFIEDFDRTKPTRVIIHGFWNSHNSRINKALKEVYLNNYDVNIIIVNYSRISRDICYKIARSRISLLGKKIAKFLDSILGDEEWQWKNLIVIGHSLGAHTAGGRSVENGTIGAIFALDPAGPGFESNKTETRLQPDDAEYVECIHTNGETLGLKEAFCQVDVFPNFGMKQPGCNILTRDLCSHSRAWKLFAESLISKFTANECESMKDIHDKFPCNGAEIAMGSDDVEAKRNASGIFYLSTNSEAPFSKG